MIAHACTLPEGDERDQLVELITIQMKKNHIAWNKDGVEDKKIFDDLRIYTNGAIDIADKEIKITSGNSQRSNSNNSAKRINGAKRQFKRKF